MRNFLEESFIVKNKKCPYTVLKILFAQLSGKDSFFKKNFLRTLSFSPEFKTTNLGGIFLSEIDLTL